MRGRGRTARRIALLPSLGLAGILLWGTACAPRYPQWDEEADFAFARARRVEDEQDLLTGVRARGEVGDFLLENDRLRVVLDRIDRPHGFAISGGNILDAAPRDGGDGLRQIFTTFDERLTRQVRYRRLHVEESGGPRRAAEIVAEGHDSEDASLQVRTRYRLEPGSAVLQVLTTLRNTSAGDVRDLAVSDVIEWEPRATFVPARGVVEGTGRERGPWVGARTAAAIYVWTAPGEDSEIPYGNGWCAPIAARLSLAAGDSVTCLRYLLVGSGDFASVTDTVFRLRGISTYLIHGEVTESRGGAPITGALVEIAPRGAAAILDARTDARGRFRALVPPGRYVARAVAPGRDPSMPHEFDVEVGSSASIPLTLDASARFTFRVENEDGHPAPARLAISNADGGEAERVFLTASGEGEIPLAPGRWRVRVTRGVEFHEEVDFVVTEAGRSTRQRFRPARALTSDGAIGIVFMAGDDPPAESVEPVPGAEDVARALCAAGVDVAAVSETARFVAALGRAECFRIVRGGDIDSLLREALPAPFDAASLAPWSARVSEGTASLALPRSVQAWSASAMDRAFRCYLYTGAEQALELGRTDLLEAVRAGRLLVTNGPWLSLRVNGQGIGDTVRVAPGEAAHVALEARASNAVSLDAVELRRDGEVARRTRISRVSGGGVSFSAEIELPVEADAWLQLVAQGAATDGDGGPSFAFTYPIYLEADGDGRWTPPAARGWETRGRGDRAPSR